MNTALDYMDDLLSLPRSDRSYLASKLIESLDEGPALSEEEMAEYNGRYERWKSGEELAVSKGQVEQEIAQVLRK